MSQEESNKIHQAPDRSVPPPVHPIERLELEEPRHHDLSNGIPVYEMHGGTEELVRVELMMQAGIKYQKKKGVARAVNALIKEGTPRRSSREIAEAFEYYGVTLDQRVDRDHAWLAFYVLAEHLEPVLALLREIWEEASFPQEELEHYIEQQKDELMEDREKVSFLARQRFLPVLFGEDHPYGQVVEDPEVLDTIGRDELLEFYKKNYGREGGVSILLSGNTRPWMLESLDRQLGDFPVPREGRVAFQVPSPDPSEERSHWVKKEGALQAALRMGKPLFGRDHPDYPGMVILSTLLGGYFGSRLMMNLREDKGYTYGVGCGMMALQDSGFFVIATEVGSQVREAAVEEIRKELRGLVERPIGTEELEHVRHYMEGMFLRSADGPFSKADLFKNVYRSGMDLSFYDRLLDKLHSITPEELQGLAREHLLADDMFTVIAGDPAPS